MKHPIYRITSFELAGPHRLHVCFEDKTSRVIDFSPVLKGRIFGPLMDEDLFEAVSIDPEIHTLVWPNGADFDPATLHDWPQHEAALIALADTWEAASPPR